MKYLIENKQGRNDSELEQKSGFTVVREFEMGGMEMGYAFDLHLVLKKTAVLLLRAVQ